MFTGCCGLVPTLVVVRVRVVLLRREQARLDRNRRGPLPRPCGASAAMARLLPKMSSCWVGDVESGLMATLLDAPATNPMPFSTVGAATIPCPCLVPPRPSDKIVRPMADSKRTTCALARRVIASGRAWRGGLRQEAAPVAGGRNATGAT